ncbi:MAG: NAD(P)H-dependent oxidoreductase [Saprospiraceae bacterium]
MRALELAQQRYATKKYNPDKKIPDEVVEELKEILKLSPSSINIQPWQFYFVRDPKLKSELADVSKHNTEKINQADLLIVFSVAYDLDYFQKEIESQLPEARVEWYNKIKNELTEAELRKWLTKQVYIALGFALNAVYQLGLDSTPMEGIEQDKYYKILDVKEYMPLFALAVGYAAADDYNRPEVNSKSRRPLEKVVKSK